MNAYYEVQNVLKTSLDANVDVNTVINDDVAGSIDLDKKSIYPIAFITIETGNFVENVTIMNIQLQALDQVNQSPDIVVDKFVGNSNELDIYNTMLAVLRRTFDELVIDKYTKDILIKGGADLLKVGNEINSIVGWQMSFDIEVPNIIHSICP
jgi:ribosomal protein S3AE